MCGKGNDIYEIRKPCRTEYRSRNRSSSCNCLINAAVINLPQSLSLLLIVRPFLLVFFAVIT